MRPNYSAYTREVCSYKGIFLFDSYQEMLLVFMQDHLLHTLISALDGPTLKMLPWHISLRMKLLQQTEDTAWLEELLTTWRLSRSYMNIELQMPDKIILHLGLFWTVCIAPGLQLYRCNTYSPGVVL